MDNGCLVVRKWQVEPAKIERRRWNRRRTTALQTLTNEVFEIFDNAAPNKWVPTLPLNLKIGCRF